MRTIEWIFISLMVGIPCLFLLTRMVVKKWIKPDKDQPEDYESDNETHLGDRTDWHANDGIDYRTKAFV